MTLRTTSAAPAEPVVRVVGGTVHLAMNWVHLAAVGVLLLVLLVVAYQTGKASNRPPAAQPADVNDMLSRPPATAPPPSDAAPPVPGRGRVAAPVATPLDRGSEGAPAAPSSTTPPAPAKESAAADTFTPRADAMYIVIQHFQNTKQQAAEAARDFLRARGVPCAVLRGRGEWVLVATEPFRDEAQSQNLAARIRTLGAEYTKSGGGYNFSGARLVRLQTQ